MTTFNVVDFLWALVNITGCIAIGVLLFKLSKKHKEVTAIK